MSGRMSGMRVKIAVAVAMASVLAGCGTEAAGQAPDPAGALVYTAADVKPPTPGGEVGSASSEFADKAELKVWSRLSETEQDLDRIAKVDVDTTAKDALHLQPRTSAWFDGFRGPFLYQELAGDIVMHLRVKAEGLKTAQPKRKFSLGGAMVRLPGSNDKPNWLSITTGTGDSAKRVEVKSTENGSSKPKEIEVKPGWVELVLARAGGAVVGLYKEEGGVWKVGARWARRDLVEVPSLQYGITGYTDWDSYSTLKKDATKGNAKLVKGVPDLKLTVDYVRFLRPEPPERADLTNPASMPDDALIKLLTPAGV